MKSTLRTKTQTKQPTVRMNAAAKIKLDQMQVTTDLSQPALLDRAVDLLERELLGEQMKAEFAAVADDPETLAAYNKLSAGFDGALRDGLKRK